MAVFKTADEGSSPYRPASFILNFKRIDMCKDCLMADSLSLNDKYGSTEKTVPTFRFTLDYKIAESDAPFETMAKIAEYANSLGIASLKLRQMRVDEW